MKYSWVVLHCTWCNKALLWSHITPFSDEIKFSMGGECTFLNTSLLWIENVEIPRKYQNLNSFGNSLGKLPTNIFKKGKHRKHSAGTLYSVKCNCMKCTVYSAYCLGFSVHMFTQQCRLYNFILLHDVQHRHLIVMLNAHSRFTSNLNGPVHPNCFL